MPLLGQSSGAWLESNAALRILYPAIRNAIGVLTADAFTQTNPPIVVAANTVSTQVNTGTRGVLSGSVAFTRPDQGPNYHGGPVEPGAPDNILIRPLGVYVNTAVGNAFENQPGLASGKNTYVSGQGTFGNRLFETKALAVAGAIAQGTALQYQAGQELVASRNGYLIMRITTQTGAAISLDIAGITSEVANGQTASTTLGILKMPPDSEQFELVYDQRV